MFFVIPTHRLREVGETVEQYDEHFWRNGHSVQMIVFDDSTPANQEKYYPLLEQTKSALLFPIDWPEPFGLVMIEALACGTPVIAWRNGSVPEIIEEGKTGFVVDTIAGAVRAVRKVASLSRSACWQVFERRFDAAHMAHDYVRVYERLIRHARGQSETTVRHPAGHGSVRPKHAVT